jgi:hypothetical protein
MSTQIIDPVDINFNQHTTLRELVKQIADQLKDEYGSHPHFDGIVKRETKQFTQKYPKCFDGSIDEALEKYRGDVATHIKN